MTYKEIIKIIKNISLALPDVESFYTGDVYEINKDQSVKYGSVVLTNQEHSFDNINDQFNYNFVLFYIDRLTDDEANRIDVQTAGINALTTIVKTIEDYGCIINNVRYNVFKERFNDWCSGVYGTFSIQVDDNDCVEEFEIITPEKLKAITINSNGTYKGLFNEVNVQVTERQFTTEELSVTANGTYRASEQGVDGFDTVEVNVKGADKIVVPDGMKFSLSTAFNPELFDVSQVTDMSQFFYKCDRIKTLDLSSWSTPSVTNLGSAFYGCYYLVSLDISSWSVEKVTSMSNLFYACTGLTSLNISNWSVSELLTMNNLFYNCKSLGSLDLGGFNVSKVTSFDGIFSDCKSLVSINLSNWNMSRMRTATNMFYNCPKLTDINMNGAILPKRNIKDWDLDTCTALTAESIVSVLNALPQLEDVPYTCAIGSANLAKLTDDQKAIATSKGWTLN